MSRFVSPIIQVFDRRGDPVVGAEVTFFFTGTSTLKTIYQDAGLNTPAANPAFTDQDGVLPELFVVGDYRVRAEKEGVLFWDRDPVAAFIEETSGILKFDSVADAKAASDLTPGQLVRTKSYNNTSASDTLGAAKYLVLTPAQFGATPDEFGDHTRSDGNILVIAEGDRLNAYQYGVVQGSDTTAALSAFLEAVWTRKQTGIIDDGSYTVTGQLLSLSTNCDCSLICTAGLAVINYTGTELGNLIQVTDADSAEIRNIQFDCNDLVAAPLDIRKASGTARNVNLVNVNSNNCKQTALTTNPAGLRVQGNYSACNLTNCLVNGVSYTDAARAAVGISITNIGGIVNVEGCQVSNVSTPSDQDADGLSIFGTDVSTITTFLGTQVQVSNCVFSDCQGRFIKMQVSNYEVSNCQFKLGSSFTTITQWRGIDGQANNGNIHDNTFRFGSGITFGSSANLFTAQNIRNDGGNKTTFICNNRCSTGTNIPFLANFLSEYGENTFVLDDNDVQGARVSQVIKFRELNLANTDKIRIYARRNRLDQIFSEFFDPFDDIDFGDKLYLEIVDNTHLELTFNIRLYDQGQTNFSVNSNFRVRNNVGVINRIDWVFDCDKLYAGNAFNTGSQANTNQPGGIGNFYHVVTDQFWQRYTTTTATTEQRRTSLDGVTWNAYVAV